MSAQFGFKAGLMFNRWPGLKLGPPPHPVKAIETEAAGEGYDAVCFIMPPLADLIAAALQMRLLVPIGQTFGTSYRLPSHHRG